MGRHKDVEPEFRLALQQEFDREALSLAEAARRHGLMEGIMRLRAMGEIAGNLSTTALLELAVALESRDAERPRALDS